jgi:peptidoglycan/LPS O-acetylase OafA/YrhL
VVVGHVPMNQAATGLPSPHWGALFYRGSNAVKLFFVLSGFLITFLLLEELRKSDTVQVGRFYLRRVCRIWPLYYAVVAFGLAFYFVALPALGMERASGDVYDWRQALVLYVFFLPNLMNALHSVGGILNPLWSIGIEEQFYLFWAPAVRRCRAQLPGLFAVVFALSFALYLAQAFGAFGDGVAKKFVDQLEFHFMAAGAAFAYALHRFPGRLLASAAFRSPLVQVVLATLLLEFVVLGFIPWGDVGSELFQLALYPWLIVTVGANPRNVLRLAMPWTEKLGVVSYGIYMLHMPIVYATSFLFLKTTWWRDNPVGYVIGYWSLVFLGTGAVALLSYRFYELPFLRLKDRRFAAVSTQRA